jgi:hypothetical protein
MPRLRFERSVKKMPNQMTLEAAVIEANRLKSQERMDIDRERRNAAIDKLIEAARFRIKRKPIIDCYGTFICPNCKTEYICTKYCDRCGQAIDWSDYL